jgi:L-alanine-DL-glutamate epimerase-like enolase superfamily enzyme
MTAPKIQCSLEPFRVNLFKPFRISRDVYDHKLGMRVFLRAGNHTGIGETQEHTFYGVTQPALQQQLLALQPVIEMQDLIHPAAMYGLLQDAIGDHPFALAAVDMAYWDLYAKKHRKMTRDLFDLPRAPDRKQYTTWTITIDVEEAMVRETKDHDYRVFKVKLGTDNDIGIMHRLLSETGADFYVDANCGWTLDRAIEFAQTFRGTRLKMIEQPLHTSRIGDMHELHSRTDIPLVADENFVRLADLERCQPGFDGVNIKLLKCGGLTPAIEIIRKATEMGLDLMVGCMTESSIGISAAMQIVPWMKYVDVDSFMFISNDPATGCHVLEDGEIILPTAMGNGYAYLHDLPQR